MKLVDGDGNTLELESAWLTRGPESFKFATHEYLFADTTDLTWLGRGPVQLGVRYVCNTEELEAVGMFVSRGEELVLWFPSVPGAEDDRYYQRVVATGGPTVRSRTANLHEVDLAFLALDPHVYDSDGQAVT